MTELLGELVTEELGNKGLESKVWGKGCAREGLASSDYAWSIQATTSRRASRFLINSFRRSCPASRRPCPASNRVIAPISQ